MPDVNAIRNQKNRSDDVNTLLDEVDRLSDIGRRKDADLAAANARADQNHSAQLRLSLERNKELEQSVRNSSAEINAMRGMMLNFQSTLGEAATLFTALANRVDIDAGTRERCKALAQKCLHVPAF